MIRELLWAVYSAIQVLETSNESNFQALAKGWQAWLDYTKSTAAKIFYAGNGSVCAVTDLKNQSYAVNDPRQSYTCEGSGRIDDPYEGELFTWWLYFFGGLSQSDRNALWVAKRAMLQSVEYQRGGVGPITVQRGFWFSAHEQWKVMEMPYYDVELVEYDFFLFLNSEPFPLSSFASFLTQFADVSSTTPSASAPATVSR